ncbi:DUF4468 domain-containing protein [Xanthocytophaga flava]|uniref:DUF4468 domain-containing protein n=1 Tax=Xanthocytophaga flava TaxID=3048013 RepID=UPI0028D8A5D6|nr:DUF4468 domain-containing protein [Xanthocytophaga flavus]MDJ1468147.1 DUF4468 domain-containing protein [Xanthocytophaga flavus]
MKTLVSIALLLISSFSLFAQVTLPIDPTTNKVSYTEVVEVPGMTKDQLHAKANEWLAKTYKSANDVIQMNDKEAGKIIAKGTTKSYLHSMGKDWDAGYFRHTLTLSFKDGKFRYEFTDFTHDGTGGNGTVSMGPVEGEKGAGGMSAPNTKQWKTMKEDLDKRMKAIVEELKKAMISTKDSEW